ncbi:hypothetical protein K490DRAFT_53351 [Saccharata proteae CBS 121410]|uniref:Uncharacterized protein n=1 Tax=Saccharata proteae CBS 121410 TaxID=1314787 RepID=A0A9P4I4A4_9PEZI|nr:hypothetical protein K490DRAFT_53351 [Saccharata proteae CBS 121410]
MSFDLLAEFGSPQSASQPQQSQNTSAAPTINKRFSFFDDLADLNISSPGPGSASASASNGLSNTKAAGPTGFSTNFPPAASRPQPSEIESQPNDDWGDFEDAAAQPNAAGAADISSPSPDPWGAAPGIPAAAPLSSNPKGTSAAAMNVNDPFDLSAWEAPDPAQEVKLPNTSNTRPRKVSAPRDPNVLFDADNLSEEDDDFGDFEDVSEKPQPHQPQPQASGLGDLLGSLDPIKTTQPQQSAVVSPKPKPLSKQPAKFAATARPVSLPPIHPASTKNLGNTATANKNRISIQSDIAPATDFDEWDDFTESLPTPTGASQSTTASTKPASTVDSPDFAIPQVSKVPDPGPQELPPTNIPPPALLLSLFPPIFSAAQDSLFKPLSSQPHQIKNKILAHPSTVDFVRGYLAVGVVAARIIAGRKLRWKRDTFLAQGMSIGPATGGKPGGMKLAAIDRSEASKEDREAADAVRAWREQLGRLRTAVVGVNAAAGGKGQLGSVPEISETMPIRTAKELEGGIAAMRACALCGLKRNERVGKVDVNVEDSFGEWWVDQVNMHRACRNFWEEHKDKLRY